MGEEIPLSLLFHFSGRNRGDESEEEYDFEYSDDNEEETDVDLENSYYSAKALKTEDPRAAVEAFREVSPGRPLNVGALMGFS